MTLLAGSHVSDRCPLDFLSSKLVLYIQVSVVAHVPRVISSPEQKAHKLNLQDMTQAGVRGCIRGWVCPPLHI